MSGASARDREDGKGDGGSEAQPNGLARAKASSVVQDEAAAAASEGGAETTASGIENPPTSADKIRSPING